MSSAGYAQEQRATPASPTFIRIGTEVPLMLTDELTTKGKKLHVGQRFAMQTAAPVVVNGQVVIPAGSPAVGEITDVRNKGMWGKSGHLGARPLYVTVEDREIQLSGAFDDKGTAGGIGAVLASSVIIPNPAGFFITGTSARVKKGTLIKGYIDEEVLLPLPRTWISNAEANGQAVDQAPVVTSPIQTIATPLTTN